MINVLILGVTGFSGKHLYNFLKNCKNIKLCGTYFNSDLNLMKKFFGPDIELMKCNVSNFEEIAHILKISEPDQIYYLSSVVTVAKSENLSLKIYNTNAGGAYNIYEGVKKICPSAKVVAVGSAEEYGKVSENELPISESVALYPVSAYGLSKKIAEEIGLFYFNVFNIDIRFTRTFHFSGPMQPSSFVISDFAKQIVEIEGGKKDKIFVGNLEAKRDFTDIRDAVRAYFLIMNEGKPGEIYNVCSGTSYKISDILNLLISKSEKNVKVEIDKKKIRPLDVPDFRGDNKKLSLQTSWNPEFILNHTIEDVLKYWRNNVSSA